MPNIIAENLGTRRAGYLVSESASMYRSRDQFTITAVADMPSGMILAILTAGGAYVPFEQGGAAGAGVATGILFEGLAAGETALRTVTTRDAEVNGAHLVYPDAITDPQKLVVNAALAERGIIVR